MTELSRRTDVRVELQGAAAAGWLRDRTVEWVQHPTRPREPAGPWDAWIGSLCMIGFDIEAGTVEFRLFGGGRPVPPDDADAGQIVEWVVRQVRDHAPELLRGSLSVTVVDER